MRDQEKLEEFTWREPTADEQQKLKTIKRSIKFGDIVLLIALPVIIGYAIYLMPSMIRNMRYLVILPIAAIVFFIVFIIRRLHLRSKYEVADVTVEEVKLFDSDSTLCYLASVTQESVAVDNIRIVGKNPEVGSKALLVTLKKDPYCTYLVQ